MLLFFQRGPKRIQFLGVYPRNKATDSDEMCRVGTETARQEPLFEFSIVILRRGFQDLLKSDPSNTLIVENSEEATLKLGDRIRS